MGSSGINESTWNGRNARAGRDGGLSQGRFREVLQLHPGTVERMAGLGEEKQKEPTRSAVPADRRSINTFTTLLMLCSSIKSPKDSLGSFLITPSHHSRQKS